MELPSQEEEMPIPISTAFSGIHEHGYRHMVHHDHPSPSHNLIIIPSSTPEIPSANGNGLSMPFNPGGHGIPEKVVKYKECLKNHAASMGGNATDGCGEFLPSGEEGTVEALTCSACNCHRNFHRKEVEGKPYSDFLDNRVGRKVMGHQKTILAPYRSSLVYPSGGFFPSRGHGVAPHQMIVPYHIGSLSLPSESDEQEDNGVGVLVRPHQHVRKRFRTKFTQEQKEKMLNFAEKVGWKIQSQEEAAVQQFCQEIGVKRRVLKVWMHNNKHNLTKKSDPPTTWK